MVDHRTAVAEQAVCVDDRRILNGIYWRLRAGLPWADVPDRYGPNDDLGYNGTARWRKTRRPQQEVQSDFQRIESQ